MSSKASILLSKDNEHWYEETNSSFYLDTKSRSAIVLEIDKKHTVINDNGDLEIVIEEGTPLYDSILSALS